MVGGQPARLQPGHGSACPAQGVSAALLVDVLVSDWEVAGDMVIRFPAQEGKHPELATRFETGRAGHRAWVAEPWQDDAASRWPTPVRLQARSTAEAVVT